MRRPLILSCLLLLSPMLVDPVAAKEVVGWVEHVRVYPDDKVVTVKAKIDSGAKTSSLHCECITPKEHDGQPWVSFAVEGENGEVVRLEKPVHRVARIKQHGDESEERYVIKLGICLGDVYRDAEVTLVDRSGYNYPMLIGRNFLEDDFLIDPDGTFLNKPRCDWSDQ